MAKKKEEVREATHYGTRNDMVVSKSERITVDDEMYDVIAADENGKYLTKSIWVGNGLMDPYRIYNRTPAK
jgi:hypothetical protein